MIFRRDVQTLQLYGKHLEKSGEFNGLKLVDVSGHIFLAACSSCCVTFIHFTALI